MKTKHFPFRFLLLTLFACSIFLNPLDAQKPNKQMWYQWDDVVYPAKVKDYVEAAKAVNEFLKEQNYPFQMNAFSSDDFHFYYTMPISGYAAIDTMQMIWEKLFKEVGEEKMVPLWKAFIGTQESTLSRILVYRPDLSYRAGTSYLGDKEANFMILVIMYPMYGMEMKFEGVFKNWAELYQSRNADVSFETYEFLMGEEAPCYFYLIRGEEAAGHYAKIRDFWGLIKDEGTVLQEESLSVLRKMDVKHVYYRKDLSYIPGE